MTYSRVLGEVNQAHDIRKGLYQKLEARLGKSKRVRVVAFFTSLRWPAMIQDPDADMVEEVLHNSQMDDKELVLLLNSGGGDALAAERFVTVCRSFSKDSFTVMVPKMAKSAATMICFGAKNICMSRTSELGPIDPQIPIYDDRGNLVNVLAAYQIVESYKQLMKEANNTRGRVDPFLQQLRRYDARQIRAIIAAQELSESIAVNCLKNTVFKGQTSQGIKKKIEPFLNPEFTKDHGRPIYYDIAQKCGLPVTLYELTKVKYGRPYGSFTFASVMC